MSFEILLTNGMTLAIDQLDIGVLKKAINNRRTYTTPTGFIINTAAIASVKEVKEIIDTPIKKPAAKKPAAKKPAAKKETKK